MLFEVRFKGSIRRAIFFSFNPSDGLKHSAILDHIFSCDFLSHPTMSQAQSSVHRTFLLGPARFSSPNLSPPCSKVTHSD